MFNPLTGENMKKLAFLMVFAAVSTIAVADYIDTEEIIPTSEVTDIYGSDYEPIYGEEVITQDYPYYRYEGYYPVESRVEGIAHGVGTATEGAVEGAREIVDSILP